MNPPICYFHGGDCNDGFGAAYAVSLLVSEDVTLVPVQYYDAPLPVESYKDKVVYIVDFNFPWIQMEMIMMHAKQVIWIDHHKTAIETYERNYVGDDKYHNKPIIVLDDEYSGAMLTWCTLSPNFEPPKLIEYVQDADLYKFELPFSREINAYIHLVDKTTEAWYQLHRELEDDHTFANIVEIGRNLLKQLDINRKWVMEHRHPITIMGNDYTACNGHRSTISDLGNTIAIDEGIGVVYFVEGERVKISLRSVGNHDVESIARLMGGGGHKHAASFTVDIDTFADMVKGDHA